VEALVASGGKRIRPTIALLVGEMFNTDIAALHNLAASIELLHTATLIHDDLIDDARLRRGVATINARWSPPAAVLAGDYVFAEAARLAAATDSVQVMQMFAETLATMAGGEVAQLLRGPGRWARDEYYEWIYAKTAALFEMAAGAAARLGLAGNAIMQTVQAFGYALGMAFQIVDDVLDFIGQPETMGKPVANDLRQGVVTLPTLIYLETYPDDPDIPLALDRRDERALARLTASIRWSPAIAQTMDEADHFVERSLVALSNLPATPERQALAEVAEYVVQRVR
jgi:geranylgeranyl pyrophosphate synthase